MWPLASAQRRQRWRRGEKGRVLSVDSGGHFEIICKRCGQRSDDASAFCGGCGAFLEWDGERVGSEASTPATTATHSVSVGATPAAEASLAASGDPPHPDADAEPSRAAQPAAVKPAAVKPAVPIHRPPPIGERTAPRRRHRGDLICGNCGEGNEATRKFCRRCGTTLVEAAVVVVPWWRRLFARRKKPPPAAGSRPAPSTPSGGGIRWGPALAKALVLAVVVIVVLFAAVPSLRKHATNEATSIRRSIHPNYPKIALQTATATNVGGCPAPRLKDNSTVYWNTHPAGGPVQVLTVTLAAGFNGNLNKIGITPMAPDTAPAAGAALPYPQQLALSAGGTSLSPTIVLANPPKFGSYTVKATRPRTIQVSAISTDPGAPANACGETALIFYDRT